MSGWGVLTELCFSCWLHGNGINKNGRYYQLEKLIPKAALTNTMIFTHKSESNSQNSNQLRNNRTLNKMMCCCTSLDFIRFIIKYPHKHSHYIITYMGIDGLLKFLQPIITHEHLSTLKNTTAAIDIMNWIYRAYYLHAPDIRNNAQSTAYLNFIQQMLDLFQLYHIDIICVFDGRFVSSKQATVDKRRQLKEANRKKGEELLQKGEGEESNKYLNRCINIDQSIISNTMRFLKTNNVKFIVAPYEADSQIAKLYNLSMIDFAVCQDSDQIIYGVPVVLKLSTEGDCDYLDINKAHLKSIDNIFIKQFVMMSKQRRTEVAVLAGTDYLPSIKGIGIKTAVKYISQSKNIHCALNQIRNSDRFKAAVRDNYEEQALKVKLLFMMATSYNVQQNRVEFLNADYLSEVAYDEFSEEDIKQIVGVDYGYDLQMSQGLKNAWNYQPRDLLPLIIQKTVSLNMIAIHEKEMSMSNSKLLRQQKQAQQMQYSPLIQLDLIMMCEDRQRKSKSEGITQLKQEWQQAVLSDSVHQSQRLSQKVQIFGHWMKYCPAR